jgi:hypothetical protein
MGCFQTSYFELLIRLQAGCLGVRILAEARDFSPATQALGPIKLRIQWLPGALSPEIKQPWHEADHPPLSSAKVKNVSSYNSRHPNAFMAWTGKTLPLDKGTTSHTTQLLKGVVTASKINVHKFLFSQVNTLSSSTKFHFCINNSICT